MDFNKQKSRELLHQIIFKVCKLSAEQATKNTLEVSIVGGSEEAAENEAEEIPEVAAKKRKESTCNK